MAFFKSFQHNLPSVNISSILDSVSSRVDDLANAVSDVTYAVSDQLTEQVTTIINKVQDEEEGEGGGSKESGQASTMQESKTNSKSMWPISREPEPGNVAGDAAEAEYVPSQLEWEWRDGCWRVKKTEAELAEEERRKTEEKELWEKKEQRRMERRQKQQERRAMLQKTKEEEEDGQQEGDADQSGHNSREQSIAQQGAGGCDGSSPPTAAETEGCSSEQKKQREETEEEEVMEKSPEQGGDDEKQAELSEKVKKKKSEKKKKGKGEKGGLKKSGGNLDAEKKKSKEKKSKKKKSQGQIVCCFTTWVSPSFQLSTHTKYLKIPLFKLTSPRCRVPVSSIFALILCPSPSNAAHIRFLQINTPFEPESPFCSVQRQCCRTARRTNPPRPRPSRAHPLCGAASSLVNQEATAAKPPASTVRELTFKYVIPLAENV